MATGTATTVVGSLPVFFTAAMGVQLTTELGFGAVGHGAAIGAFFGSMAVSSIYLGRVADRLGATLSLRIATVGAATAAFGIAVMATSWLTLALGLVVAGLSAALAQPAANRLLVTRIRTARLGTAFGLKQSAPPTASMLAGLAVPGIALTVGWRWAYVLSGVGALVVALAVGRRPSTASGPVRRRDRVKLPPLAHRATLVWLGIGLGFAFASSSIVLAFYVDGAVQSGMPQRTAGAVFAAASLAAVLTRLLAGIACDRFTLAPLRLSAALLAAGAAGIGLLATGRPVASTLGAPVGLAGSWGFPGVFWLALVRAYPERPGRITGTMAPAAVGGIVGPVGFGAVVTNLGYSLAWGLTSVLGLAAATAMLFSARRLAATAATD